MENRVQRRSRIYATSEVVFSKRHKIRDFRHIKIRKDHCKIGMYLEEEGASITFNKTCKKSILQVDRRWLAKQHAPFAIPMLHDFEILRKSFTTTVQLEIMPNMRT